MADGKREEGDAGADLPQLVAKHRLLVVAATGELEKRTESGAVISAAANSGFEAHPDTLDELDVRPICGSIACITITPRVSSCSSLGMLMPTSLLF